MTTEHKFVANVSVQVNTTQVYWLVIIFIVVADVFNINHDHYSHYTQ